jgi:hypothetical protein
MEIDDPMTMDVQTAYWTENSAFADSEAPRREPGVYVSWESTLAVAPEIVELN